MLLRQQCFFGTYQEMILGQIMKTILEVGSLTMRLSGHSLVSACCHISHLRRPTQPYN